MILVWLVEILYRFWLYEIMQYNTISEILENLIKFDRSLLKVWLNFDKIIQNKNTLFYVVL